MLFDAPPRRVHPCACPNDGPVGGGAVRVRDLDRDGEPEVLVDLYSGGAHCCFYTDVYRYVARSRTYRPTVGYWGDLSPRLADLGGDGRPEFRTGDDRFAYVFGSFAASAFPIRILRFDHGRFVDVTRHFPRLVRRDAAQPIDAVLDRVRVVDGRRCVLHVRVVLVVLPDRDLVRQPDAAGVLVSRPRSLERHSAAATAPSRPHPPRSPRCPI